MCSKRTTIHKLHPCSLPFGQLALCKPAILPICRLKRAQKLPQIGLSLATTGQVRQAARVLSRNTYLSIEVALSVSYFEAAGYGSM